MKKIGTVFQIDRTTYRATDEVRAQWVIDGEGIATIKHDGTSCLISGGQLFKRFDAKKGRALPDGFLPCEAEPDPVTGHWPGWVPVRADNPADQYHLEALRDELEDGTYELVGPKVQRNRYRLDRHELWRHGAVVVDVERTPEGIHQWLIDHEHEGIVFHHKDGRMAKVRRKDFRIPW